VVQVFEMGVDGATDLPFIAMELLEGESLQERLARCGTMTPTELLRIVSQVARALTRAHALGIIHRDLKPANLFLVRDGETELTKVLDFGIAKRFADSAGRSRTITGDLLGTPTYMSPEQITGSKQVDHRSDLWSLAVIAVECLTGRLPFDAEHLAGLALAICEGRSLLPSNLGPVPPGFDAWFEQATSLRVEARFNSAAQLAEALCSVCGGEPMRSDGSSAAGARGSAARASAASAVASASSPAVATTRMPSPRGARLRTVQLLRPQQLLRLRTRRRRFWAALAAGGLLVWVALSVRLPVASSPRADAGLPSAVPASVPPGGVQRAEEADRTSLAPRVDATRRMDATPRVEAAPVQRPTPPQQAPAAPQQRPAAPRRAEAASSGAPAAPRQAATDPDNLGF
jgi:serine/threonine-protein kinase